MNDSFAVVAKFEERVAEFCGAKYGVAVATGTWAIFLACQMLKVKEVRIPARTFISVPMAVLHAGGTPSLVDFDWKGVYELWPYPIWDAALRWRRGMFSGGLQCLSFQARKHVNIGEGGMVLTDDREAAEWLKAARYSGRRPPTFAIEDVTEVGWQAYMTPEKAARGLHLLDYARDEPDQMIEYPDLRNVPLFKSA